MTTAASALPLAWASAGSRLGRERTSSRIFGSVTAGADVGSGLADSEAGAEGAEEAPDSGESPRSHTRYPTTTASTAMTATTTFLSLLALVLFGGTAIEGFALVMLFGVVVCTYSAMFVSTPVLLYMDVRSAGAREEAQEAARSKASAAKAKA